MSGVQYVLLIQNQTDGAQENLQKTKKSWDVGEDQDIDVIEEEVSADVEENAVNDPNTDDELVELRPRISITQEGGVELIFNLKKWFRSPWQFESEDSVI